MAAAAVSPVTAVRARERCGKWPSCDYSPHYLVGYCCCRGEGCAALTRSPGLPAVLSIKTTSFRSFLPQTIDLPTKLKTKLQTRNQQQLCRAKRVPLLCLPAAVSGVGVLEAPWRDRGVCRGGRSASATLCSSAVPAASAAGTSATFFVHDCVDTHGVDPFGMSLLDTLVDSDAIPILLSYLCWSEIVAVASTSTRIFVTAKRRQSQRRADVSCGASPYPVPCDSPHCPPCVSQAAPGISSETTQGCKWNLGGPLPPSFTYRNEAIHTCVSPGDDFLEGCACFGQCDDQDVEGVGDRSPCLCVQLNAAVQR